MRFSLECNTLYKDSRSRRRGNYRLMVEIFSCGIYNKSKILHEFMPGTNKTGFLVYTASVGDETDPKNLVILKNVGLALCGRKNCREH